MDNEVKAILNNINDTLKELTAAVKECGRPKEPDCRTIAEVTQRVKQSVHQTIGKSHDKDAGFQG